MARWSSLTVLAALLLLFFPSWSASVPVCANPLAGCVDFSNVNSNVPANPLPNSLTLNLAVRLDCPAGAAAGSVSKDMWTDLMDNTNWNKFAGAITSVKCTPTALAQWQPVLIHYASLPPLPVGSGRVELHVFFVNPGASWDTRPNNNVLAITVVGSSPTPVPSPTSVPTPPPSDDWVLVWNDEFDGDALDPSKWAHEVNGFRGGNDERQVYVISPDTLWVKDGLLNIRPIYVPEGVSAGFKDCTEPYYCDVVTKWKSARIRTFNATNAHWKYGRFVFNAKMPLMDFCWAAFWMMSQFNSYGTWAASGEIDILETKIFVDRPVHRRSYSSAAHFSGVWPYNAYQTSGDRDFGVDLTQTFNDYEIVWDPDVIRWKFNGVEFWNLNLNQNFWYRMGNPDPYNGQQRSPFDQPFHLIINWAVGGNFFNSFGIPFDDVKVNASYQSPLQVNSVRVYQRKSQLPSPLPTPTPTLTPVPTVTPTPTLSPSPSPIDCLGWLNKIKVAAEQTVQTVNEAIANVIGG